MLNTIRTSLTLVLVVITSLTTKGNNLMENYILFDKKINDTLQLQFSRVDNVEEYVWQTNITNLNNNKTLKIDSYSLKKKDGVLGDSMRIVSGEDMIFHHDIANVILIGKELYVVHNKGGNIFLNLYQFSSGEEFTKYNYYLVKYRPIGALGKGFQYADFLHANNSLYILVNAGCEMMSENNKPDWLFRFCLRDKKLFSISFNSIKDENEDLAIKVEEHTNPFKSLDLKIVQNNDVIKPHLIRLLDKEKSNKGNIVLNYWGALENKKSYSEYHSSTKARNGGKIFFFYNVEEKKGLIRFISTALYKRWLVEDYTEIPLSEKKER